MIEKLNDIISYNIQNMNQIILELDSSLHSLENQYNETLNEDLIFGILPKIELEGLFKLKMPQYLDRITEFIELWNKINILSGGINSERIWKFLLRNRKNLVDRLKTIGVEHLKKKPTHSVSDLSSQKSLTNQDWLKISFTLQDQDDFSVILKRVSEKYEIRMDELFLAELDNARKMRIPLTKEQQMQFKKVFLDNRTPIKEWYSTQTTISKELPPVIIEEEEPEEKEKIDVMDFYLNADDRTLARMKRTGKIPSKGSRRRKKKEEN